MLSSTVRDMASSSPASPPHDSHISRYDHPHTSQRCLHPSPTIQSQNSTGPTPTHPTPPPHQLSASGITPTSNITTTTSTTEDHHHHHRLQEVPSASTCSAYREQPSTPPVATLHRRQQSSTSLLPLALINRATSPERRQRPTIATDMPYTGEGRSGRLTDASRHSSERASGRGASSASSPLGIQGVEGVFSWNESTPASPEVTPTRSTRMPAPGQSLRSPASSRFAFITSGMSAISSRLTQVSPGPSTKPGNAEYEISNLDVEAALFPGGAPAAGDAFSPAAYKNLQVNAVALVRRLQNAFTEQAGTLRELTAEREADRDELDEATTRARHLKMQLEDMAYKAADQERAMRELLDELATERRKTVKLLAAAGGVSSQRVSSQGRPDQPVHVTGPASEVGSIAEDLEVDAAEEELQYRRRMNNWRSSGGADSFDTDDDSMAENESLFSRSRSSTTTDGPISALPSVTMAPPPVPPKSASKPSTGKGMLHQRSVQPQQKVQSMSAFQKLVRNVTSNSSADNNGGQQECMNCRGQDSSVAWDTVGLLRDENRALKERVGTLEGAVESALDLVNGVGM